MNIQEFIRSNGKELEILTEQDCVEIVGGFIVEDEPGGY